MASIHVWPDEIDVAFDPEANLLTTLVDAGIPIDHLCGGRARCSTCRVFVSDGLDKVSDRNPAEAEMATKLDFPDAVRLACQTTMLGSAGVRRLVLDKTDERLVSQLGTPALSGPVGREVSVAVLFIDVVGYTKMAAALPPYDVLHLLNRFFSRTGDIVAENAGVIDNYMGDAVLALFGLHDEPDPVLSAVRSGLGALDAALNLSRHIERAYRMSFQVRVGVDFGDAIFGLVGTGDSARQTVIGDVVNVASRLESANKETGTDMLVSDAVYERTAADVEYARRFELDLRGKAGRVVAHELPHPALSTRDTVAP
jgi:class 3 adenylate cyclase